MPTQPPLSSLASAASTAEYTTEQLSTFTLDSKLVDGYIKSDFLPKDVGQLIHDRDETVLMNAIYLTMLNGVCAVTGDGTNQLPITTVLHFSSVVEQKYTFWVDGFTGSDLPGWVILRMYAIPVELDLAWDPKIQVHVAFDDRQIRVTVTRRKYAPKQPPSIPEFEKLSPDKLVRAFRLQGAPIHYTASALVKSQSSNGGVLPLSASRTDIARAFSSGHMLVHPSASEDGNDDPMHAYYGNGSDGRAQQQQQHGMADEDGPSLKRKREAMGPPEPPTMTGSIWRRQPSRMGAGSSSSAPPAVAEPVRAPPVIVDPVQAARERLMAMQQQQQQPTNGGGMTSPRSSNGGGGVFARALSVFTS